MKQLTDSDTERRLQAVQDALASAAREGQRVSPEAAADLEAYVRGEITTDEIRRYKAATRS